MERVIKIGVRQLVEFCCRSGDLGYDDSPGVKARDGLLIHQKIQKRYQHEARAEYPVNAHLTIDDYRIELGGRIDLVFADESPPRIEEIKTVYHHQEDDPPNSLHWAQLKCYAACYCAEKNLDQIAISLNLVNQFTAVEQRSSEICTESELSSMLLDLLRRYLDWQQMINQQQQATALSARDLAFPFADFRKQQHRFAAEVYRAIQHQHRLLVEAPTGSGKTMSTLFPSIKALGENHCDQIIYLSAKVSGQQQAVNAIEIMIEQGLDASYLVLQAKSRCCPCNSDDNEIDEIGRCQRCIGFFDRLPAAREQLFKTRIMNIEQIQQCASDFQLCPFELALQMLEWVDIVICDFNYIFDPMVQLSYFKTNPRRKLLLIDELHNLVDRARDMYSSSLSRAQLKKAISSDNSKSISSALKTVQQSLDKFLLEQLDEYSVSRDIPQPLLRASYRFAEGLGQDLFSNKHISPETLEFAKSIFRFQCIAQLYDQHHRTIGTKPLPRRELKLLCLNAFEFLRDCYPMFHAVCGFSATLSPGQYFQQALGMDNGDPRLMIESSFPREHQLVCIGDFVDGRYQQRELHLDQICQAIQLCQHSRPGNYLAFFSSYYFMQQVYQRFGEMFPDLSTRIQQREFNAVEQQQFLDSFQEGNNQTGFAIMGGRFAEGVDLPGNALIGAILVGVGLPQANQQQQLIAQDFETMQLNGFDHAFRYPGLIRVLQSAGRVIRSETDRGIILLLDQRFKQPGYYQHLPGHWQTTRCGSLAQLELELDKFWLISG